LFLLEPISPELVLVDPTLARADFARVVARSLPELATGLETGRAAADRAPPEPAAPVALEAEVGPRRLQGRVLPILLALSLAGNGVLLGIRVGGGGASVAPSVVPSSTQTPTRSAAASRPPVEARAAIEQRILAFVVQSPAGKLPPTLIDQKTGLAKNNLRAVCRSAPSNAFLCVVRPVRHRPGEGLQVRYRPGPNGHGSFLWYPYRSG
jgi:hypothetical protein